MDDQCILTWLMSQKACVNVNLVALARIELLKMYVFFYGWERWGEGGEVGQQGIGEWDRFISATVLALWFTFTDFIF